MRNQEERRKKERQHQLCEKLRKHVVKEHEARAQATKAAAAEAHEAVVVVRAHIAGKEQEHQRKDASIRQAHHERTVAKRKEEEAALLQQAERTSARAQVANGFCLASS